MTNTHDRILLGSFFALPFALLAVFVFFAIAGLPQYAEQPQNAVVSTQPAPIPVPVERGGNR